MSDKAEVDQRELALLCQHTLVLGQAMGMLRVESTGELLTRLQHLLHEERVLTQVRQTWWKRFGWRTSPDARGLHHDVPHEHLEDLTALLRD